MEAKKLISFIDSVSLQGICPNRQWPVSLLSAANGSEATNTAFAIDKLNE